MNTTENDTHELLAQIRALREEVKEFREDNKELRANLDEHKKMGTAIYQKTQRAVKTMEENANRMEGSHHKVITVGLERIHSEIQGTIDERMQDNRAHFEGVVEKVGDTHHQEMNGLWHLLCLSSIFFALVGSIIGGLTVYYFEPRIDADVAARLQAGAFMEAMWPKLSQSEQEKLVTIAQGKKPAKQGKF